jgi:hypothetical protein
LSTLICTVPKHFGKKARRASRKAQLLFGENVTLHAMT